MGITKTDLTNLETKITTSVDNLKETIEALRDENTRLRERLIHYDIAIDDLEQYGRRMCVRVEGVPWAEGETNEELQDTLVAEFGKLGVVVEPRDIVRLHRSSKPKEVKRGNKVVVTKQAIIRFSNWRSREKFAGLNKKARQVEKTTKKPSIRVNNDLTKRRLQLLTSARQRISVHLGRLFTEEEQKDGLPDADNVFAYANINSDLRMRIRGRVVSFNSLPELEDAIKSAFPDETPTA